MVRSLPLVNLMMIHSMLSHFVMISIMLVHSFMIHVGVWVINTSIKFLIPRVIIMIEVMFWLGFIGSVVWFIVSENIIYLLLVMKLILNIS